MTRHTKEQIDPCLNCDSATCMREYDYPCNDRIRYLYKLQKNERKKKNSPKQGKILEDKQLWQIKKKGFYLKLGIKIEPLGEEIVQVEGIEQSY